MHGALAAILVLAGCAGAPPTALPERKSQAPRAVQAYPQLPPLQRGNSRWTPAPWADLPGFEDDPLHEAWNAWVKSCERPASRFAALCSDIRLLSLGTGQEQRAWMRARLQPYRVETLQGDAQGLLTGYFEPMLEASRQHTEGFNVPLYAPPASAGLRAGQPGYSRRDLDTLPEARTSLRGRELAWLADPVDALLLQIQGSGRLRLRENDGSQRWVRLSFAGSNNHPYQSPGRWLLEQRAVQDASWPGIKTWIAQNPQRLQELMWSNPRVVFFRAEALSDADAAFGPKGAQGVALTPQRSIAVDPNSIPYGTPVWLASSGPVTTLQKLVLAQDTGSAIVGALRADYFAGWGAQAGELAGRLKQPLQMWVLWPK
jgi:membrane-bound lytic murein transglycosylase A